MKCVIPEISWHNRDPVLSVDIQPKRSNDNTEINRLASGGTDSHVLIWYLTENKNGTINLDIAADLTRHQKAVNCVRWSPSGEYLASADDESVIFIWKLKSDSEIVNILDSTNDQDKEIWLTYKILRGHMEDVYDLCWSPNSLNLISGSVDNTAMVWDAQKGKALGILSDHKSFVQGVAWDPQNQYLATLCTDRYLRTFDVNTRKVINRSSQCSLPVSESSKLHGKTFRIFHDDTLQTFFRRLCFSPDGELLIAPSGVAELNSDSKPIHTTYIYTRYNTKQPAVVLPSPDQYTIAVRCCPLLFELHEHNEKKEPVIALPYRMIFAVATKSSVYLYDTQQPMPFGIISNIHYTRLTDLAWSSDGRILIVSSTDGFCTIITFSANELGTIYNPPTIVESSVPASDAKDESVFISSDDEDSIASTSTGTQNSPKITDANKKTSEKLTDTVKVEEMHKLGLCSANELSHKRKETDTKPTPIAFRRTKMNNTVMKAEINSSENVDAASEKNDTLVSTTTKVTAKDESDGKPTPIAFRRKPRTAPTTESTVTANAINEQNNDATKELIPEKSTNIALKETTPPKNAITLEIQPIIISSQEKFHSPEIVHNKPATPIQIRREPRNHITPSSTDAIQTKKTPPPSKVSPLSSQFKLGEQISEIISTPPKLEVVASNTEKSALSKKRVSKTPKVPSAKKATPITVRRHQRNILPTVPTVDRSATEDEALDAWPIDQPKPITIIQLVDEDQSQENNDGKTKTVTTESNEEPKVHKDDSTCYMDVDESEDIRLVYDDSQTASINENDDISKVNTVADADAGTEQQLKSPLKENGATDQVTPNCKTPRRVELRTLSTPKSKKKLL